MPSMIHENEKPLVLITGSSGLIGARLADALRVDYRVVGLDVEPPDDGSSGLEWIDCDMTDDESVAAALEQVRQTHGAEIASVVHLAAYYDFSGEPSPLYRELTVAGTGRLLRGLSDFTVEQFVFSSTLLVMQSSQDDRPVDANSPIEAEWDYPQSKLAAESMIRQERGDIPAVVLRMAGVYDEQCHSLPIAQQISRIHQKQLESYFFPGDKTCGQAFIHLDDLIACIERVIQRRGALESYEVFVIGEEDVMSYEELQDEIGHALHGREWPAIRIPKVAAKAGAWVKNKLAGDERDAPFIKPWMIDLADQNYPVNIERAKTKLDWLPEHTLRRTLPVMIDHLRRDPQRWYEINKLPLPEEMQSPEEAEARRS